MILQILILNEKVKKSAYVTGDHLEGFLSCVILKYCLQKTKQKQFFFIYRNFHFKPYSQSDSDEDNLNSCRKGTQLWGYYEAGASLSCRPPSRRNPKLGWGMNTCFKEPSLEHTVLINESSLLNHCEGVYINKKRVFTRLLFESDALKPSTILHITPKFT